MYTQWKAQSSGANKNNWLSLPLTSVYYNKFHLPLEKRMDSLTDFCAASIALTVNHIADSKWDSTSRVYTFTYELGSGKTVENQGHS